MKTILALSTAAALLAAPVAAQAGFDADIDKRLSGPVKIEVMLSESLEHRADNLPKEISLRRGNRLQSAFANNGHYGQRDLDKRVEEMVEELTEDFAKAGVTVDDNAATVLRVTLVDLRPNRPTFSQLSDEPGLSFRSFGVGGAKIEGELIAAGGEKLGTMAYDYFPTLDNYGLNRAAATWSDADRAISRFSKRAVKKIAPKG
jgi:hypothetical protein